MAGLLIDKFFCQKQPQPRSGSFTPIPHGTIRYVSRACSLGAVMIIASSTGCSSSSIEPTAPSAAITLVSGANQTVSINPTVQTKLPQLVVVRVDSLGRPKAGALVIVSVTMNGEPKQQPTFSFLTESDGIARMQLQVGSVPGPVSIVAEYVKCKTTGFACLEYLTFASLSVPGIIAQ